MKNTFSLPVSFAILGWIGLTSALFAGTAAKDTIQRQFTVTPGSRLIVDADTGDLELKAGETSEFKITIAREVHCKTEAEGQKWLADHQVTFDQAGDTVTVKATIPVSSEKYEDSTTRDSRSIIPWWYPSKPALT